MCRGDFQTSCAEFDVDIAVLDYGNHAVHKRHDDFAAFEPCVLRILGVDAHGCVPHNGFRTGCGYHGIALSVGIGVYDLSVGGGSRGCIVVGKIIAQVVELALLLFEENFVVADGRTVLRVPVDHAEVAVDKTFVVEVAENLDHAFASQRVHGKCRAVPVA